MEDTLPPPYRKHIDDDAWNRERVRRFFSVCLANDYDCRRENPDLLRSWALSETGALVLENREDLDFFGGLNHNVRWKWQSQHPRSEPRPLLELPQDCVTPDLEDGLLKPARALGIPESVIVCWLRLHHDSSPSVTRPRRSTFRMLRKRFGFRALAARLCMDRDFMIDAVIPSGELREKIRSRNEEVQKRWFKTLNSADDFVLHDSPPKKGCGVFEPERVLWSWNVIRCAEQFTGWMALNSYLD